MYEFIGFFASAHAGLDAAAAERWPKARVKLVERPFKGVGLRLGGDYLSQDLSDDEFEEVSALEEELPDWTRNYPDVTFVYIEAECYGSDEACFYDGYVCRNGRKIVTESPGATTRRGSGALRRLLAYLGVELDAWERFAPFERGWWER